MAFRSSELSADRYLLKQEKLKPLVGKIRDQLEMISHAR